ncbi:MAG: ABC transporter permease, partial [Cypionkella sp.]
MAKPDTPPAPEAYKSKSRFGLSIRRFRANPLAVMGIILLACLLLVAIFGPMLWHYGFTEITPDLSQPPSWAHPLGTDTLGRDMLALVMRGMQQSLLIAGTVAMIATVIGTLVGVVSGYFGGLVDASLMRLVDLVLTIPTIALAAFLGSTMSNSGVSWLGLSLVL